MNTMGTAEASRIFASMCGNAVLQKYGPKYFAKLGKLSGTARRKKKRLDKRLAV